MRIALYEITSTVSYGGIQTFVWAMAGVLAEKGHDVHVYGGKGEIRPAVDNGVKIFTFPYLDRAKIPNLGSRFRKFVERLSFSIFSIGSLIKGQYDIIYVHKPYDLPVALLASRISGAHTVFGSGGTEFFPGYRYLVKKVDHFFACSRFNASQIEEYCGIRPEVLPNGVDTELFRPMEPAGEVLRRLGLESDDTVIISACRLVGWKGIQYAIKAVARLIGEGYCIKYVIIGGGEYRQKLENLARTLGVENRILFQGGLKNSELPRYYSIAQVAVFPSTGIETFGISIAEAMSCGVPVVSTTAGGIPEVVAEGTGLLVPPMDEITLSGALETLITDRALREKMSAEGRRRIIENFSWDVIVERFGRYIGNA